MIMKKPDFPKSMYQCVSQPGRCKFEWCCGPLCACVLKRRRGTDQEGKDVKTAERLQSAWRHMVTEDERKGTVKTQTSCRFCKKETESVIDVVRHPDVRVEREVCKQCGACKCRECRNAAARK